MRCVMFNDSLCVLIYLLFFFFFKQKTAYEMRISDWSSDVCSSDLLRRVDAAGSPSRGLRISEKQSIGASPPQGTSSWEIGRASCRERVCQSCRSRWSPYH